MASVIEIPKRAITQSSTALMSNAFEKGDIKEVNTIYAKASINQLIIGSLLLVGVWSNVQNIFNIMPKGDLYSAGTWVILIVGSAKLLDMAFGPSSEVIGLSKYYWFNLVVISLLAILVITSNVILIPIYGMNGAALGTLLALSIYNIFKFGFIIIKMKLNPFTINTIKVLVVLIITYFLNGIIPQFSNAYLDIIIRSGVITLVFSSLILLLRCSEDANKLFRNIISRVGIK
jgi:O-antigen/teichoic acid export membrane protein